MTELAVVAERWHKKGMGNGGNEKPAKTKGNEMGKKAEKAEARFLRRQWAKAAVAAAERELEEAVEAAYRAEDDLIWARVEGCVRSRRAAAIALAFAEGRVLQKRGALRTLRRDAD